MKKSIRPKRKRSIPLPVNRAMAEKVYLAAAYLCERVLIEKDEVVSTVRIVDTLYVSMPPNLPADAKPMLQISAFVSFKGGPSAEIEKHQLSLETNVPSGAVPDLAHQTFDFVLPAGEVRGANLAVNINLAVQEFGLYWINVSVDGEPVTRIPFRLLERLPEIPGPIH